MKLHPLVYRRAKSMRVLFLLPLLLVATICLRAAAQDAAAPHDPKTHALFMGADISVERDKTMYRVLDVQTGAFVIKVGGKEVKVPADWNNVVLKVDRTLKLTDSSASVTDLKGERAYTLANDPIVKFQKGLADSEMQYADSQAAQNQANAGFQFTDPIKAAMGAATRADGGLVNTTSQANSAASQNARQTGRDVVAGPGSTYQTNSSVGQGEGMFDAMEITFQASSVQPLNEPYVVILGQYREKDAPPGKVANWIYAQPLKPIGPEVRKIHIVRGGFPRGFEMVEFQMHLYDRGKEIATDVAPKRVQLTRDEAFTYALMEYLSSHKGANTPATPFMGKPSAEAKAQMKPEQWEEPYYVKVSKDGLPIAAFTDTKCSRPADKQVGSVVTNIRFYPALENGKGVEGVAEVKFLRLVL